MKYVGTEHGFEFGVAIYKVMVCLQIAEVVIDGVVDEGDLDFAPRDGFLKVEQVCEIIINQILCCGE